MKQVNMQHAWQMWKIHTYPSRNLKERDTMGETGGWEDRFKLDLKKMGRESVDWIHLAPKRVYWWALVNAVINLRVSWMTGNFLSRWETVNFSKSLVHGHTSSRICYTQYILHVQSHPILNSPFRNEMFSPCGTFGVGPFTYVTQPYVRVQYWQYEASDGRAIVGWRRIGKNLGGRGRCLIEELSRHFSK
jgi:hypothetical protein